MMRKSPAARIVNVTTVAVPLRLEGEAVYAASKSALETFTRIAAHEVAPFGITCNAVGPCPIKTELTAGVPATRRSRRSSTRRRSAAGRCRRTSSTSSISSCGRRARWSPARSSTWEASAECSTGCSIAWRSAARRAGDRRRRGTCPPTGSCSRASRDWQRRCADARHRRAGRQHRGRVRRRGGRGRSSAADHRRQHRWCRSRRPSHAHRDDVPRDRRGRVSRDAGRCAARPIVRDRTAGRAPATTQALREAGTPGPGAVLVRFDRRRTRRRCTTSARCCKKFNVPRHCYRTLVFLQLDHIGGVNTLFYTLSNGGAVVVVGRAHAAPGVRGHRAAIASSCCRRRRRS